MNFAQRYPGILARYDRFWKGEETDRPVLFVTAPKDDPDTSVPPPPKLADPAERVKPEHMVASARYTQARTAYFAEAHPRVFVNFGPGVLHGAIGGELDLSHSDTTWFPRFLDDVEQFPSLRFDPEGKWWRRILRSTEALLEEVGEEMLVSITDIGGCGDVVASAVGRQILLDIAERPEAVQAAVDHCHTLWVQAYESNYALVHAAQDVTTAWWPIVSRGRTYMTQCDINALISPASFSRVFLPELSASFDYLDDASYHLDGVGTECQMPALVAQPGLRCIQWVPAPGTSALAHADMLRQIQEAGVSVTFNLAAEEVEAACRALDPRRLLLNVWCGSEGQARELVASAARWCV